MVRRVKRDLGTAPRSVGVVRDWYGREKETRKWKRFGKDIPVVKVQTFTKSLE